MDEKLKRSLLGLGFSLSAMYISLTKDTKYSLFDDEGFESVVELILYVTVAAQIKRILTEGLGS